MLTLPLEDEGTFLNFSDLLTGYRLSAALMLAHGVGVFESIGQEGCEGPALCARKSSKWRRPAASVTAYLNNSLGYHRPDPLPKAFAPLTARHTSVQWSTRIS